MPKIVDTIRNYYRWLRTAPNRSTTLYPRLLSIGRQTMRGQTVQKSVSASLRQFSRTPIARKAINTIKNPIKHMEWEIVPRKGISYNSEIKRQIRIATACFSVPNQDDSFATFIEKVVEDYLAVSAGAYEQQPSPMTPDHPVFMWPVDGESIQIYPGWAGNSDEPRYKQVFAGGLSFGPDSNLADDELVYITPNPSAQTPYGYGPLEITAREISRLLGANEFAGNVASNAQPANILWLGDVGTGDINAFRSYWQNEVEGRGETPIVGGPDEPKAVRLTSENDDGLYLKWQEFLIRNTANGFDLTPETFGLSRGGSGNRGVSGTPAPATDPNWQNAVVPMAMTIADYLTRHTILKVLGFSQIQFTFPGLKKEDEKKQAEICELLYQNNAIVPNDTRHIFRMEPSDDPYCDITYAEVQVKIGEARRGEAASQARPGIQHNQPPKEIRRIRREE